MALGSLVDKPLMQNPLAGGGANMFNVTPPSVPVSEQTPLPGIIDPSVLTPRGGAPETDDPIMQGFYNSEFYKPNAPTTMDVVNYTYQGNPMTGSSSNISQFQQFLDSIGKGNLIPIVIKITPEELKLKNKKAYKQLVELGVIPKDK